VLNWPDLRDTPPFCTSNFGAQVSLGQNASEVEGVASTVILASDFEWSLALRQRNVDSEEEREKESVSTLAGFQETKQSFEVGVENG
jgi:hypothetical protein